MIERADVVESSGGTEAQRPRYRPIGEYGAIGDCRTAALVAPDGAIDWCCLPHFDSPAIFCRLLDADKGGYFQIAPQGTTQTTARYLDGTNILETLFAGQGRRVQLLDFMPVRPRMRIGGIQHTVADLVSRFIRDPNRVVERNIGNDVAAAHRLERLVTAIEGDMTLEVTLKATFDYARALPEIRLIPLDEHAQGAILWVGHRYMAFVLRRDDPAEGDAPVTLAQRESILHARLPLRQGQRLVAMLNYARTQEEAEHLIRRLHQQDVDADFEETQRYWCDWSAQCRYDGRYKEAVLRSALALKLCTFEPTGAIVAAPTTSLPEAVGGPRNWDYRYTWLRDSSFTLEALDRLGYNQEARDYFHFLHDLHLRRGTDLRIMYGIHGESGAALREEVLTHLEGYRGSQPVRIGNGAALQRQMDVYGELIDAAYRYLRRSGFHDSLREVHPFAMHDVRSLVTQIADYVARHWQEEDQGIWEVRGAPRAFVYSRAMCWAALDRACQLSSGRNCARWSAVRERIRTDIMAHGYDAQRHTFVQAYGSDALDAANLRLPLIGFIPATDERMLGTIDATIKGLSGPHGLLYRYRAAGEPENQDSAPYQSQMTDDGLSGGEGAFVVCTYWLINDLCRAGRIAEARQRFEELMRFASPLGLFAEEIDFQTGALLGNYPQALTHIGLINTAVILDHAEKGGVAHGAESAST
jgi:GH15 family glucan-1,4-alpha-glucosidase